MYIFFFGSPVPFQEEAILTVLAEHPGNNGNKISGRLPWSFIIIQ
jgi:hypothetical protein